MRALKGLHTINIKESKLMLILISFDGVHYNDLKLTDLPNVQKIIKNGLFVKRLETVFPSVTWNIHTSVVTGQKPEKHRIYGNSVFNRDTNEGGNYSKMSLGPKEELVKVPTFYDKMALDGKKIAAVCWPLTQGAKNIDMNLPEFYTQEEFDNYSTKEFFDELKEKGFNVDRYGEWSEKHSLGPLQDSLTAEIIEYIIKNKKADVILGHFLLYDSFQHDFGVGSPEALWALRYIDSLIGRIMDTAEAEKIENLNFMVFSDHGHSNIKYPFDFYKVLSDEGCETECFKTANNGGSVLVYALENCKSDIIEKAKDILKNHGAVDKIIDESNMNEVGWSVPDYYDKLFPSFIVALKEDWCGAGDDGKLSMKSMHGYLPSTVERMNGFMASCGTHFEKGSNVDNMEITKIYDIAMDIYEKGEL